MLSARNSAVDVGIALENGDSRPISYKVGDAGFVHVTPGLENCDPLEENHAPYGLPELPLYGPIGFDPTEMLRTPCYLAVERYAEAFNRRMYQLAPQEVRQICSPSSRIRRPQTLHFKSSPDVPFAPTPLTPVSGWITESDYPPAARQRRLEGKTDVQFIVGTDGRARDCAVTSSGGSSILDEATCRLLLERARFRVRNEGPLPRPVLMEQRWELTARTP